MVRGWQHSMWGPEYSTTLQGNEHKSIHAHKERYELGFAGEDKKIRRDIPSRNILRLDKDEGEFGLQKDIL